MDTQAYKKMADEQRNHWWFKARRDILEEVLSTLNLKKNSKILEAGCGPGGNLALLSKYGDLSAVEMDDFARNFAKEESPQTNIVSGWLPDNMPFSDASFDLICLFDVLEHIEDDVASLQKLRTLLKPSGKLIITIPAFQWLYGPHDKFHHHFRRYNETEILRKTEQVNLKIKHISFFNTYLFPFVLLSRLLDKLMPKKKSLSSREPSTFINTVFYRIFRKEKNRIMTKKFAFGASLLIVLEKKTSNKNN